MKIAKVGVVGCGQMGGGIIQVCAQAGYQVVALEINDELLQKGLRAIAGFLIKSVEKGKLTKQEVDDILSRIKGTTNYDDFKGCDLVIEAAVENMAVKKKIFAELERVCPPHAILASNTSCLSIIEMAMATKRPDKVLGLHFMNPVPLMKLMEIVKTIATSDETVKIGEEFGNAVGKTVVIAKDSPGFIVNALLLPYLVNAIQMLDIGIAKKEDIDTGITLGLNHPMGPLTLADLIGLDTVLFILEAMYQEYHDVRYSPPPLLRKMVSVGWLGRKTGKGFYDYK